MYVVTLQSCKTPWRTTTFCKSMICICLRSSFFSDYVNRDSNWIVRSEGDDFLDTPVRRNPFNLNTLSFLPGKPLMDPYYERLIRVITIDALRA